MSADDGSLAAVASAIVINLLAPGPGSRPVCLGISGPQGAGKTTLARHIADTVTASGGRCAVLSLDDYYLPRAERLRLAQDVHPLCAIRGVPGTHDAAALLDSMRQLRDAGRDTELRIPRFSKALDDRLPECDWAVWRGIPDCVVLEGWCVGARPAEPSAWQGPINAREARDDPDGRWWRWSNAALARDYPACWDMLDRLCGIILADFDDVIEGRYRQERDNVLGRDGARRMSRDDVIEFVSLFERLTRRLQQALPRRADYVVRRDAAFHFTLD